MSITHCRWLAVSITIALVSLATCARNHAAGASPDVAASAENAADRPSPGLHGPLRVHPENPRYFTDDSGRAILLTGSHTWNNLVDMGPTDPPPKFDYDGHLKWLAGYPHNFFRLWAWELMSWDTQGNREKQANVHYVAPQPWKRIGPGKALDGKPRFDLRQFDEDYFARLRRRVAAAGDRGIYASVMLFEGWGLQFSPGAWEHHPFHPKNNISGIDGDLDGDGMGLEIHRGVSPEITELQRAYVRKVIDTVNDLDNVLYEISNENHPVSTPWQYEMVRFIKRYEQTKPKQHPVGMTFQYRGGSNQTLFDSPADWVSPNPDGGYRDDPPVADGRKVVINDTDHLWGIGGNPAWVWKSFMRGHNPLFMDPGDGTVLSQRLDPKTLEAIRKSMGQVLQWSRRVDLAKMTPRTDVASSKFCLARDGAEYMAYLPPGETSLRVKLPAGQYACLWSDATTGKEVKQPPVSHQGGDRTFDSPHAGAAVLYLQRIP